jgi:hypothetical protein
MWHGQLVKAVIRKTILQLPMVGSCIITVRMEIDVFMQHLDRACLSGTHDGTRVLSYDYV